ncbi:MAG: PEP/pyruvate-binding domain-containing protein, partial [Betaproteobacteria bacterium]
MQTANDICSLDYLIGTLSTAYKGVMTSLVAKDFCMTEAGDTIVLKGRILSLPAGNYEASLIRSGVQLVRAGLEQGYFEFRAERERVMQAKDLQVDILQEGRHIGTFLLKRERVGGFYISAVELSDEIKGMDFRLLTAPLRDKIGLLQKAEEIITKIHSPKKDWAAFSELMHGFMYDTFWSARSAFYQAFPIVVRFSVRAAERADLAVTSKPVANVLDCAALPLERDEDVSRLRSAIGIWLNELAGSTIDLSSQLRQAAPLLRSIHERFPAADIGPVLAGLLGSLRKKLSALPALSQAVLDALRDRMAPGEYGLLARYGAGGRMALSEKLAHAGQSREPGAYQEVFDFLVGLDPGAIDDGKMIDAFFDAAARHMSAETAAAFSPALSEMVSLLPSLSKRALDTVTANAPAVMEKLISIGRGDACASLLADVDRAGPPITEEIGMNARVAAVILHSNNDGLISQYRDMLSRIIVPTAKVREISTETWAEIVNPLHLERLIKFLDILQLGGGHVRSILVHVIANLFVSGVFIPDDRLFQRRISAYLNSKAMREDFLLNFLFLGKLPAYYNEVGAVSRIRDFSTEIDSWGDDPVLYFLRKQVHVNASNYNVRLIEKVLASWVWNDPGLLRDAVPRDVYDNVKPELFVRYSAVIRPFLESLGTLDAAGLHVERLLDVPEEEFQKRLGDGQLEEIPAKVMLLCRLYQEIVKKYSLVSRNFDRKDIGAALAERLEQIRKHSKTVLAPEKTLARESLYFKRHIAFGIPSVLGTYHEPKFDALAELMRNDAGISVLLEDIISGIEGRGRDFSPVEAEAWLHALAVAAEVLKLHGLGSRQVEELVAISAQSRLFLSQAADLLRMWQKELAGIVEFINHTFHRPLTDILKQFPKDDLPEYLMNLDPSGPDFTNKAADIIIRDIISSVPGLVESDRIIEHLLTAFRARVEHGADDELHSDQPEEDKQYFELDRLTDQEAMRLAPMLGNKAKNLVYLANRGFRVPAGVAFSARLTELFRTGPPGNEEFIPMLKQAVKSIEDRTGMHFGDAVNPLFLSVRSGSYVSMPGILSTVLYCGMNEKTLRGFMNVTNDPRLAWDSYRRFIEHYAAVVMGFDGTIFDTILNEAVKGFGLSDPEELGAGHLEEVVERYRAELAARGRSIPDDVYEQLQQAVRAIYVSWYGDRAAQFRRATKTSEHWGTAVTLMQMVYGNRESSGASVFFTRNPFTYAEEIYGETRERATGDELVYGKQLNRPLSKDRAHDGRQSLEERDPELYRLHRELAREIEQAMGGLPQEVEVTYTREQGGARPIFVLQSR